MSPRWTRVAVAALGLCLALVVPASAFGLEAPTSGELVNEPKRFDGMRIEFKGEAIGEAMRRGENAWLHLNDDAYMLKNVEEGAPLGGFNSGMPVWAPGALADRVEVFGDYKHQGDVVRVEGVFNAACTQHGGDMDIHADSLRILAAGRDALDAVHPRKAVAAVALAIMAGALWYADRRSRWKELRGVLRR